MDILISLLATLNSLSPLAVIALLGAIIFLLVKNKQDQTASMTEVKDNHLHELPQMAEDIRIMAASLQRIEVTLANDMGYIRARLNGGPRA